MNRRELLKTLSLSTVAVTAFKPLQALADSDTKPIVLSTWYDQHLANIPAWNILKQGGNALDAVETGVQVCENDIENCCVGLGGNPDRNGIVTLDACIMDHKHNIGSVAALERIKNPIRVARLVMEKTQHVMLAGQGAQDFAVSEGFELQPTDLSDHAQKAFRNFQKKNDIDYINIEKKKDTNTNKPDYFNVNGFNHDTIGMIALDAQGNLSGACTTSGMAFKMHGRVGDSPIIGAGLYVDNEIGAATATGHGEEVIRISGSHLVVEFMRQGYSPKEACKKAVERIKKHTPRNLNKLQIGFIALNKKGEFGAYSLQSGFDYAVYSATLQNEKFDSDFLIG
ncbi:MAG: N(4)-(beta-N-acetylglucosaminyl)-L-asparaginase [Chitinophagaceae bacterium]|nr:N(4)-(beta-N-acetylglucosaminyl)-L-asparaginase [Chitinophagaceae bacterium]